jgi:hypothetical protein
VDKYPAETVDRLLTLCRPRSGILMNKTVIKYRKQDETDFLLFTGPSSAELRMLRKIFRQLAENEIQKIDLVSLDWIQPDSILKHIELSLLSDGEPSRTLRVTSEASNGVRIEWRRHSEGWLENAELLDGLTAPGHQFLDYGSYGAVIEISYLEELLSDSPISHSN